MHQRITDALRTAIERLDTLRPAEFDSAAAQRKWDEEQMLRRDALGELEAAQLLLRSPVGPDAGHTKGPWRMSIGQPHDLRAGLLHTRIVPAFADGIILNMEVGTYAPGSRQESEATCRRIVACVNVLEGIPTAELEAATGAYLDGAGAIQLKTA